MSSIIKLDTINPIAIATESYLQRWCPCRSGGSTFTPCH